jgi:hypothetical protein
VPYAAVEITFEAPPGAVVPLLAVVLVSTVCACAAVPASTVFAAIACAMSIAFELSAATLAWFVTEPAVAEPDPVGWLVVNVRVICAVVTLPAPLEPPVAEGNWVVAPPVTSTASHVACGVYVVLQCADEVGALAVLL